MWGIDLNNIEKKSFYSFLLLYLSSSFVFVLLSGFWYYSAQKNSLESMTYYKLQHYADNISGLVINAHMLDKKLTLPKLEEGYSYKLIRVDDKDNYELGYYEKEAQKVLVSSSTQEHLMIKYVVVSTNTYQQNLKTLQRDVITITVSVFILIIFISWFLSKLFMRPIHEKMNQIEQFIQDISHELNTPITALSMSAKRALQKKVYDPKILLNISISTKQLYRIYKSLAYLNFSSQEQVSSKLEIKPLLEQTIQYYKELLEAKNINVLTELQDANIVAVESRIELLFSNLLANAIKYSMPNTQITIKLKENFFSIEDQGIGIESQKIDEIFKLYERNSALAGGFGIGLNIVKKICNEFRIAIEVKSKIDEGSCFILKW